MMNQWDHLAFTGFRIIEDARALKETDERLFPESRHRSARIRKKLIKRFGGEFRKVPAAFEVAGGPLIVHPAIADQMRREIAVKRDATERAALYGGQLVSNGETRSYQEGRREGWWKYGRGVFNGDCVSIFAERNWTKFSDTP